LLAQRAGGELRYSGKVGTGFSNEMQTELLARFEKLAAAKAPLDVPRTEARGARWLKPELVAEIAFAQFTAEGIVRHASFLGLRGDKPARDVVREEAEAVPDMAEDDVRISNPDRVIFPEAKVTKGQLADYYRAVGPL